MESKKIILQYIPVPDLTLIILGYVGDGLGETIEKKSPDVILQIACKDGYIELARLAIEKCAKYLNGGLAYACGHGHIDIVRMLIENGADNFDIGLINACSVGNAEIAELMIGSGAKDFDGGFELACSSGDLETVQLMLEHNPNGLNSGLYDACFQGYGEIVRWLVENYSSDSYDWNFALSNACRHDNTEIVRLLLGKGANNLNQCLAKARKKGHHKVAELLIDCGADDNY